MSDIEVDGDVAKIRLTSGSIALIDAADIALVAGKNWYELQGLNTTYAITDCVTEEGRHVSASLHRVIMKASAGDIVDHIDRNGLNCRKVNLRFATKAQNARNQCIRKNNKSGYKGVSWRADRGKWQAHIRIDGKRLSLGHHDTPEDAANAYERAAIEHHGEFASTGKPPHER